MRSFSMQHDSNQFLWLKPTQKVLTGIKLSLKITQGKKKKKKKKERKKKKKKNYKKWCYVRTFLCTFFKWYKENLGRNSIHTWVILASSLSHLDYNLVVPFEGMCPTDGLNWLIKDHYLFLPLLSCMVDFWCTL